MTPQKLREIIIPAWAAFEAQTRNYPELARAVEAAEQAERDHRGYGRRVFRSGRYRLSVEDTALYFVIKNTHEQHNPPKTWIDAASWRRDRVLCQALRERLVADDRFDAAFPNEAFLEIDYAGHIAA